MSRIAPSERDDVETEEVRVRVCPMPEWSGAGHCRWCNGPIFRGDDLNLRRSWHSSTREGEPDCLGDYMLHTNPQVQFRFIAERDGEKCFDCGVDRTASTVLEVEHDTPLWLVVHLGLEERRRYFGPANLRLRCRPCHAEKTGREAAQRGKVKRIIRQSDPETRRRSPRPLKGRGFDRDPLR